MSEYRANILIVDDALSNLQLLASMLSTQGYKVRGVPNGKTALMALQGQAADLVLLDINMPDMDGYLVCQQIKSDEKTHDIPVIFVSAMHEAFDKVKAFSVGGADYITKPFQVEEVLARVENQLKIRRLHQKMACVELWQDTITGTATRAILYNRLQQLFDYKKVQQQDIAFSLILLSLDNFYHYQQILGHHVCDELLQNFAHKIQPLVEHYHGLLIRLHITRFAILLEMENKTNAYLLSQELHQMALTPFIYNNSSLNLVITTTIVEGKNHYTHPEHVLREAEQALLLQ